MKYDLYTVKKDEEYSQGEYLETVEGTYVQAQAVAIEYQAPARNPDEPGEKAEGYQGPVRIVATEDDPPPPPATRTKVPKKK